MKALKKISRMLYFNLRIDPLQDSVLSLQMLVAPRKLSHQHINLKSGWTVSFLPFPKENGFLARRHS